MEIASKRATIATAFKGFLEVLDPNVAPSKATVDEFCATYPNDTPDADVFMAELLLFQEVLKTKAEEEDDMTYRKAADIAMNANKKYGLYPAVSKAYKLLLTAAPSVCKDERSFSKLKFVKSSLRSSMGNARLNYV